MALPPTCELGFPWSYGEVVDVLRSSSRFGMNPSLDAIEALTEALGGPQHRFATVQVTGTNGKTSVSRMTAAILNGHGIRTGLYTSPELVRYPERIEVGGAVVADEVFARAVGVAIDVSRALWGEGPDRSPAKVTEFELLTAAALWLFAEESVDVAVLEVGLGGRWDATSVVHPGVAVITGVALDHTAILGETREAIAAEKAAIIKPASAPVLGPGTAGVEKVFLDAAEAAHTHPRAVRQIGEPSPVPEALTARFRVAARPASPCGHVVVDVRGVHGDYTAVAFRGPAYQAANIATAVCAAEAALGRAVDADAVRGALAALAVPGRFECVREEPAVVIDVAHNPDGAAALAGAIAEAWPGPDVRPTLLLGVLADKDARGIVEALAPVAGRIAVTASSSPRAMRVEELARVVRDVTGRAPDEFPDVSSAVDGLMTGGAGALVVAGSVTTAGEARGHLLGM